MTLDPGMVKGAIRTKVIDLAAGLGTDASDLGDDDIIPTAGYLDSAAILELIVWFESEYDFPLKQEEINIDNLGSINAMVDFLIRRKLG